jgi:hypothetical protein
MTLAVVLGNGTGVPAGVIRPDLVAFVGGFNDLETRHRSGTVDGKTLIGFATGGAIGLNANMQGPWAGIDGVN